MAYNLVRNSKVFVTTNLNTSTGAVLTSGFTNKNTWELQVLDGFKFSQSTNQATIQINEAGTAPIRGQRAFNTALNPVDISFSTYIRPRYATGVATSDERVLWNALFGSVAIDGDIYVDAGVATTNTPLTLTVGTTATRASTAAGLMTISGATITGAVANTVYNIKNVTTAGGAAWQGPVKLLTYTAGGTSTFEYLTPPAASAGLTSITLLNSKWDKAAWYDSPTHGGNTLAAGIVTSAASNKNQLLPIGFIFIVDSVAYTVDNCAMDGAQLDFGLDAIATIAWTAKGTKLNQLATVPTASAGTFGNGLTGTYATSNGAVSTTQYITNKLSTVTLQSQLYGRTESGASTAYTIVLTGGSLQISNNINYVTPANLGTVNVPIGYFTGNRAISGTLNAYLRTGTGYAADLLSTMLTNIASASETKYRLQIEVGGASNPVRVELDMPGAVIGIPSVDVADVVSTAITFNAQAPDNDASTGVYDLENTNELTVRYLSN